MLDTAEIGSLFAAERACDCEGSANAETLRQENQRLKNLLITVATIVLKSIVEANNRDGRSPSPAECACLFEKAEECFLAARADGGHGVAESLEAAGRALLARAIELRSKER